MAHEWTCNHCGAPQSEDYLKRNGYPDHCARCEPIWKEWLRLHDKYDADRDAMMWDAIERALA